jgi:hypothetical protein
VELFNLVNVEGLEVSELKALGFAWWKYFGILLYVLDTCGILYI